MSGAVSAVVVENLTVRYGELLAVDAVSFAAAPGQVTTVLGRNGAGKTSTIEVCEGFRRAATGTVRVLGLDPGREQRKLSERMGVMLQEGGVYPSARVADTVALYCQLYQRGADPDALVELVGLSSRRSSSWRRLSGGERQRLSLALALACRPQVAFLDEPTSGVDVEGRAAIREILRGLAGEGCAVVLATHELDEAERVSDRVLVFEAGRIVADGTLDELRGTRREVRVRTAQPIDAAALGASVGAAVHQVAPNEYAIEGGGGEGAAALVAGVTAWLDANGAEVIELRAGSARLEDVFRGLVGGGSDNP